MESYSLKKTEVLFGMVKKKKKVLEMDSDDGCTTL